MPGAIEALFVTVHSPDGVMFQGMCSGVTAVNLLGPFDILPNHENFITHINGAVTLYIADSKNTKEIPVQMGVLRVLKNDVVLYVIMSSLFAPSER
jgi:F0F1-type ATP synthase epsilon subunit